MSNLEELKIENPSWWRRRSKSERCLYILTIILVLIIICILFIVMQMNIRIKNCTFKSHPICFTPKCIKTAANVLDKIDINENPCEDFYKFACGNFIKNTIIPKDKSAVTSFSIVSEKVQHQMRDLLEEPIIPQDIKPVLLAKSLYQACMNTSEIEAHSLSKFKQIMNNTGGWPVIEGPSWNETNFNWTSTSYKLMGIGINADMFINLLIQRDVSNSSTMALYLDQVAINLDKIKKNGFNETIFQAYYNYMVETAIVFGAEKTIAQEEMKEVAELIISLARINVPTEERRDPTKENNRRSVKELEEEFDYVPWLQYINTMLTPYKTFNYNNTVIVTLPKFYKELGPILKNTPKRVLANYMYWCIIEGWVDFLNEDLKNLELIFNKEVYGVSEAPERWKQCTTQTLGLYVASGALYVKKVFNKNDKKVLIEMVDTIRHELQHTLETIDWIDNNTKDHALEKLQSMKLLLAYPDELLDDTKTTTYYEHLYFNSTDYLGSVLNLSLFKNYIEVPQLDKIDEKDWRQQAYVTETGAFYFFSENRIELLAGILQDIFFNKDQLKYMNYGSIGHVIGHEMTHGFDDQGKEYDSEGNLANWWLPETKLAFNQKAQCFVDQYGNVTLTEVDANLNGINTQGENIADSGGIKLAYLAYKKWAKKYGPEPVLPGLQFTPEQMYWIAFGNVWCHKERTEQLKINLMSEFHTPNAYRVNLALKNSEYFAKDFNCPVVSEMNPKKKCSMW